jgi:hypothetical protein
LKHGSRSPPRNCGYPRRPPGHGHDAPLSERGPGRHVSADVVILHLPVQARDFLPGKRSKERTTGPGPSQVDPPLLRDLLSGSGTTQTRAPQRFGSPIALAGETPPGRIAVEPSGAKPIEVVLHLDRRRRVRDRNRLLRSGRSPEHYRTNDRPETVTEALRATHEYIF